LLLARQRDLLRPSSSSGKAPEPTGKEVAPKKNLEPAVVKSHLKAQEDLKDGFAKSRISTYPIQAEMENFIQAEYKVTNINDAINALEKVKAGLLQLVLMISNNLK
jgi:hypothetical protein